MKTSDLYLPSDAAKKLHVNRNRLLDAMKRGEVRYKRLGNDRPVVRLRDVKNWYEPPRLGL